MATDSGILPAMPSERVGSAAAAGAASVRKAVAAHAALVVNLRTFILLPGVLTAKDAEAGGGISVSG